MTGSAKTAKATYTGELLEPTMHGGEAALFTKPLPPVILASQSPRRRTLLEMLGLQPKIMPAGVDEAVFHWTFHNPKALVTALSQAKCRTIAKDNTEALVIAADTIVAIDGTILGQPEHEAHARQMLSQLQGRTHQVVSSISVSYKGRMLTDCQTTEVTLVPLDETTIANYVATGEPLDKAGAYAVQGIGGAFVEKIDGCYFNVVGLSLNTLRQLVNHLLGSH